MARLTCGASLGTIILDDTSGRRAYNAKGERQWNEVQDILSKFGITFPSRTLILFEGEAYGLRGIPGFFGSRDVEVFYKGSVIAKATVVGSNYCDSEGELTINLRDLRSIYEA